jgi:predicted DsbA family dithiol-disulfide isomerase
MRYPLGMSRLTVEIWSDIACPWCWVGKRHLKAALAQLEGEADVRWRAFELDPSAPPALEGDVDYVERLARKYRTSRGQAQAMIDHMTAVGERDGIDFRFDRIRPGSTFDAHRLLCWAASMGRQNELKERLFRAYLHEGRSMADHDALCEAAADVELDAGEARAVLTSDACRDEVREEEAQAAQFGITGVPFFVLNRRVAVQGAQPAEVLLQAMQSLASTSADRAAACGPDGCGVLR